jgi:23S rRNA pseudouridine2457 synthase
MDSLILVNKPMNVLSQFSAEGHKVGLSTVLKAPGYRVAGRLDSDSEGLLILTNDGRVQARLTEPNKGVWKQYWVQVEGLPQEQALEALRRGVLLKDGPTLPARVDIISPPAVWERSPPIRYRANIPTTWLNIQIQEGRNRQIRRMTAAVGHPTLRLVRHRVGDFSLGELQPGEYRRVALPSALVPLSPQRKQVNMGRASTPSRPKGKSEGKVNAIPGVDERKQKASKTTSGVISQSRAKQAHRTRPKS